ncbi:hypothetical protein BJ742DRAFT_778045 [Cladochytrium replicatum]|nr:hypothetical protein BJ742DRAFT_778045 [Cladochytrium replicatum]
MARKKILYEAPAVHPAVRLAIIRRKRAHPLVDETLGAPSSSTSTPTLASGDSEDILSPSSANSTALNGVSSSSEKTVSNGQGNSQGVQDGNNDKETAAALKRLAELKEHKRRLLMSLEEANQQHKPET